MPKVIINKLPSYLDTASLQPGDILAFRVNTGIHTSIFTPLRTPNHFVQTFLNAQDGESESKHIGMVIRNEKGELEIAHLVTRGFVRQPILADKFKSTIHVFRPKNAEGLTRVVNELILNDSSAQKQRWNMVNGIHSLFGALTIPDVRSDLSCPQSSAQTSTFSARGICSQFVVEAYQIAANQDPETSMKNTREFMNVRPNIPPKELHAYLYRSSHWDSFVIPHAKAQLFTTVKIALLQEIAKIDDVEKRNSLSEHIKKLSENIASKHTDVVRCTIEFMRSISPILSVAAPHINQTMQGLLRTEGIRPECYENDCVFSDDLAGLAKQHYGYNDKQAKVYAQARSFGMSDHEARTEAEPNVGSWFGAHSVKTVLSALTVVPFLVYVLPSAIAATEIARERLEATEPEPESVSTNSNKK